MLTVGSLSHLDCRLATQICKIRPLDLQYNILSIRYYILTEEVKFELDQLAQASQILPGRVL